MGILPYNEEEKNIFVGRENETEELYGRIVRNEYTVYYAASGEGKSSLIKAGLLPILREKNYFPIYIVFTEDDFVQQNDSVGNIIHRHIVAAIDRYNEKVGKKDEKVEFKHSLWFEKNKQNIGNTDFLEKNDWWKIRDFRIVQRKSEEKEFIPLLVFDQFEEVFTKTSVKWTDRFFEWLEIISIDGVPMELSAILEKCNLVEDIPICKNFKTLFSFRTEYLGELDYWCIQKHFIPALLNNRLCLKQMTINGANEVIGLNSELKQYAADIICGCADEKAELCKEEVNVRLSQSEDCSCVHALVLSVLCRTLSEYEEDECSRILEKLSKNQIDTVNEILLNFYKEKLKDVGLDPIKDERIISRIENALIDENGKRKRLNTDDPQLNGLEVWTDSLVNNGFIKVVGRNESSQTKTIEFPHDRLCKAIDTERKNRQKRIRERLNRQEEWMQFGMISFVMLAIAYVLKQFLSAAAPALRALFVCGKWEMFIDWLSNAKSIDFQNIAFNESFCVLVFLLLSLLFVPFVISKGFKERSKPKPSIGLIVLSSMTTLAMFFVTYKSYNLSFTEELTKNIIVITFISCLLFSVFLAVKRFINRKMGNGQTEKIATSWPLLLGYFLFGLYGFHVLLFNTVVGINEPCDSGWLASVLPFLLMFGTLQFFKMSLNGIWLKYLSYTFFMVSLIVLIVMSFIPHSEKQLYGMPVSIAMLLIATCAILLIAICANCRGKERKVAIVNKISFSIINICMLFILWYFGLGYNPFVISSNKIVHVYSWRTVVVQDRTTDKYGVLTANGECIIPFVNTETSDSVLMKKPFRNGYFSINNDAFKDQSITSDTFANGDSSFVVKKGKLTGEILVVPTLEEYLISTKNNGLSDSKCTLEDSIAYYAACAFTDIRLENIRYAMTGKPYDESKVPSLALLDSLQAVSLLRQIKWLNDSTVIDKVKRSNTDILDDDAISAIYRELARSMLLGVMRERLAKKDIVYVFQMHTTMAAAYFYQVPGINFTINSKVDTPNDNSFFKIDDYYTLYGNDFNANKLFAWYDLFCQLCDVEVSFHPDVNWMVNYTQKLKNLKDKIDSVNRGINGLNPTETSLETAIELYIKNCDELANLEKEFRREFSLGDNLDYIEESISFSKIHMAIKTLSIILLKQYRGAYNNALENSYLKFLNVGFVLQNDMRNDIEYLDTLKTRYYRNFGNIKNFVSRKTDFDNFDASQKK